MFRRMLLNKVFQEGRTISQELRVNERIRVKEVRLVDGEGNQVGVLSLEDARAAARDAGLDLVEVSPNTTPPVCRLLDYGKYKYKLKKRHHSKTRAHAVRIKEVRLRPRTDEHDFQIKVKKAREFLGKNDKVVVNLFFRGRELNYIKEGSGILDRFKEALADIAKLENESKMERKRMSITLAPKA